MKIRQQQLDERNIKNKQKNKKSVNHLKSNKNPTLKVNKVCNNSDGIITDDDFNKFIELIKSSKTFSTKKDLMLGFINKEADEINKTIT
jgi:hypothetical protein